VAVRIIPKEQQAYGAFNGGEIVENKPIGFPQDHSSVRPYSNLFYWAHARAVTDSTIGLHPHQGFEICSFVLKGEIRHFDTRLNDWRPLSAGDVQIIRAGNGISHSEWMGKDGEMFQIWFDPNLRKTLSQPASYDDYRAADFPVQNLEDTRVTILAGEGSPMRMDTPGVQVYRISLNGEYTLPLQAGSMASLYLISGVAAVGGQPLKVSDFGVVYGEDSALFSGEGDVFVIVSPIQPGYATYGH
jgi:redox-sensitive bicupin YhaK (pirin superfamily)